MNDEITWHCKPFAELSPNELYDILQLRSEVFVVEQNCVFLEPDGKIDKESYHLFAYREKQLVACCRLIDIDISYPNLASIGRVANAMSVRGTGIGRVMMNKAINLCKELFGLVPLRIGAQFYLKNFYESLGFVSCNDNYMEDGIEHVHMELIYE
jgi:ElaA protein